MKITFKDLKQQKFVIEAEPSEKVSEIKAKIEKEKGWEPSLQKLIYSGKILQDDNTIESYGVEEKGFIVCMIQKPKAAPAASSSRAAPSTPAPVVAQTPAAPAAPAPVASSTTEAPATPSPAPQAPTSPSNRRFDDPSTLTTGEERNNAIADMENMGFARSDIDRAMRAAFFNPDRAVEYLLSGIPEHLQREDRPAPAAGAGAGTARAAAPAQAPPAATSAPTESTGAETGGEEPINLFEAAAAAAQGNRAGGAGGAAGGATRGAGGAGNSLDFLRNNPQFQQLRQLVQQQPQMLEPILQQVGAGNPQLAQLISQRPEEFLQLLAEDNEDDAALPPGAQAISVTEEEREAIERLCRLGFERDLVIQAYFACDKNEELAANFLFDQPDDDEQ